MSRARRWWAVFVGCNFVVAGTLVWMTSVVIELERAQQSARAEAAHHDALRAAMWRMDSWLSVFLAREAARPIAEYRDRVGGSAGTAADGSAFDSPLFELDSEYLRLYVELDGQGRIESPQVPLGPLDFEAQAARIPHEELERRTDALEWVRPYLDLATIRGRIARADSMATTKLAGVVRQTDEQQLKSQNEYRARVSCAVPPAPGSRNVGRLVPMWLDHPAGADEPALVFMRRVRSGETENFQGFAVDWPALHERLLLEIRDLFADAELERVRAEPGAVDPSGRYLANIPAALVAPGPAPQPAPAITPARVALGLAWAAALIAAVAVGATLRTSIQLAERRRRFALAVTHELRTPLTTFRLYTEMLSNGVVRDPEQRRQYLDTLNAESGRLSSLVENVLSHARLEEGRAARRLESTTLDALLDRLTAPLGHSAEAAGVALEVDVSGRGGTPLAVDAGAIERVLCNLVDNAGKYASNGSTSRVRLHAAVENGSLSFRLRDHGPGVPRERVRTIFEPFDRGGRDASDPVPGVGLGLALSRDLARDMGGDLTLEHPAGGGACFRLELPTRAISRHRKR